MAKVLLLVLFYGVVLLLRALRFHKNLLVPLQTVALIWADRARLEGLPGVFGIARIFTAAKLEHGIVLVMRLFLFKFREIHRREISAPVLVKLLLT